MTPSFCFDAVMLRLAPNRPFFEGWGPNYIHPQTCFSDFRFAPKASFETPGGYASLAARKETSASRPHPPPKGHACLIGMRQHAAFGPPPWWGGSISEKSSSEAKDPTGCLSSQIARFDF